MVTRGAFQGEDAMEDKRLAAIGPNPSGLCMCGCGLKTSARLGSTQGFWDDCVSAACCEGQIHDDLPWNDGTCNI
jgi:hypothetical protein